MVTFRTFYPAPCYREMHQGIFDEYLSKGNLQEAREYLKNLSFWDREDAALRLIDKHLNLGDFKTALEIFKENFPYDFSAAEGLAETLKRASGITYEVLKEVEGLAQKFSLYPRDAILRAVAAQYRKIGKIEDAKRLERDFIEIKDDLGSALQRLMVLLAGFTGSLLLLEDSIPLAVVAGVGTTLLTTSQKAYSLANLLGLYSGITASVSGFSTPASIGIGAATAVAARNPFIQKTAKAAFQIGLDLPEYAILGIEKTLSAFENYVLAPLTNATIKAAKLGAKSIDVLDDVLDVIACR